MEESLSLSNMVDRYENMTVRYHDKPMALEQPILMESQ